MIKIGYVRVSSDDQNAENQVILLMGGWLGNQFT